MEALDFPEIARLINKSKTTEISYDNPVETNPGWSLYEASHKVHSSEYPFSILYFNSRATRDSVDTAKRRLVGLVDVHVVYPPSLDNRLQSLRREFEKNHKVWTTKEYVASFIRDELGGYTKRILELRPTDYEDPPVEVPAGMARTIPNPLKTLLLETDSPLLVESGVVAVLLAEPGQGKSYMSRFLVSEVAASEQNLVPLMIEATQWTAMSLDDQASLWKTITHSFRHFDAPIGWLDGNEDQFLRTTLKADLFRIVFDGFDEYILVNRGKVQPLDVLESLAELASETGARIVITSRTSFWEANLPAEELKRSVERSKLYIYQIRPFNQEKARNYFVKRLGKNSPKVQQADALYRALKQQSEDLAGRGFVLKLIADLVAGRLGISSAPARGVNAVLWLVDALCEREELRQKLEYDAEAQVRVLQSFASETAMGNDPNSELLSLVLESIRPELESDTRQTTLEKLKSHPLIGYDQSTDRWLFREEQVRIALIAEFMTRASDTELTNFVLRMHPDPTARYDLGQMIVDVVRMEEGSNQVVGKLRAMLRLMVTEASRPNDSGPPLGEGPPLAGVVALYAVDKMSATGAQHSERAELLRELAGVPAITGVCFSGAIARCDLRSVEFTRCRFERVTWVNCTFDETTIFRRCHFTGGTSNAQTKGLGQITLVECTRDIEADQWLNRVSIAEGKKRYGQEELRTDVGILLRKFLLRGGPALRGVKKKDILKGPIADSRYREEILEALAGTVLDLHGPSSNPGYDVLPGAIEDIRFYATNNVMTGTLKEAWERLVRKLRL